MMSLIVTRYLPLCLWASLCVLPATRTLAAERFPVTSMKPLLIAAIERGEAHGRLVGEAASFMQKRFGTAAPVEIDVRALAALPQAGCSRLEVTTRQNAVRETGSQSAARKELVYQVSYCRDGSFPQPR